MDDDKTTTTTKHPRSSTTRNRNPIRSRKASALVSLRNSRLDDYEAEADDAVYDLVDEEEYVDLVNQRRHREDFVVDDDGLGYHDDGEEYFGHPDAAAHGQKQKKKEGE